MRQGVAIFLAAAAVAASLPFLREHDGTLGNLLSKAKVAVKLGSKAEQTPALDPPALADIDLAYIDDRRDVVNAPAHGRRSAELTVDPEYQRAAVSMLRRGQVHEGAVVMTDVRTGRVLVWANYNRGRPRDLAREAKLPAASIFKVVTAAALVEKGVRLNQKHCYHGGRSGITERLLEPDERRDKYCATMGRALGRSLNVVFGRLAKKHLTRKRLNGAAHRLGWGLDIPFDVPVEQSTIDLPDDDLEFARAAAGFWHTTLSPFQGVNLAQTIANGGEMIRTYVVDRVTDEEGESIYEAPRQRQVFKRVLNERTAWSLARMMEQTVRNGTSFKTFHDRAGRPYLPNIAVAGKTGTLNKKKPETMVTWWVGFAPADKPEVAISAVVLNRGAWRIKGTHVASEMLRIYFADAGRKGVHYPPGFRGKKRRRARQAKKQAATKRH